MLNTLIPTLKSGLEIAFLLAVLYGYMDGTGQRRLLLPLKWGAVIAVAASPGLAYAVDSLLEREVVEGAINLVAAPFTLALVLWVALARGRVKGGVEESRPEAAAQSAMVFLAALTLILPMGLDIASRSARLLAQDTWLLSTETASKLGLGILALSLAVTVGVTLHKTATLVKQLWVRTIVILILLVLLLREAITSVQVLLVRGILPLTDWLFRIMVPLVNNYSTLYYALFASVCALVLLAIWERRGRRRPTDGLNPAEKRKFRATSRRLTTLTGITSVLLALAILADGASAFYANRPLELSPAVPVSSQSAEVLIPVDSMKDKKLHRFSYAASDGTVIRFLVVHKGSGVYGVGLDACSFCGVAGYHQDGENVVCARCGAAINVATIGFNGGCNPIPLRYSTKGDSLVIPVETLEAATGVFRQ